MDYIKRHWRGELTLAHSFWINMFLLNIVFTVPVLMLNDPPEYMRLDNVLLLSIAYMIVHLLIIYPWQVIGTWRSSNNHIDTHNRSFWARVVQVFLVLGVLSTVGQTITNAQLYSDMFKFAARQSDFSKYSVSMTDDNSRIHLKGYIGPGTPKDILRLLKSNSNAEGIILDSRGGLVKEAMAIHKIIKKHNINTYTLDGCLSACTIAFIAGKERYIGESANLGFHGFRAVFDAPGINYNDDQEQHKVEKMYRDADVSEVFIDRMFTAQEDDMWYPAYAELIEHSVVQGETSTVEVAATSKYKSANIKEIEDSLLSYEPYRLIKQYEPDLFQELTMQLETLYNNGASMAEIQRNISGYIEKIAMGSMGSASDETLESFIYVLIKFGRKVGRQDPFTCVQYYFPDQYGNADVTRYLAKEDFEELNNVFSMLIKDGYTEIAPIVDKEKGEAVINAVVEKIGDDAKYLDPANTHGDDGYKKACDVTIAFYDGIMRHDKGESINALRYLFASQ